jgi:hypothetical protein
MPLLPATGTEITFTNVKRSYTNAGTVAGGNYTLRGTLGGYVGISSGSITLSSTFGGRTTPYAS